MYILTPAEQAYTLILHAHFRGVNRPDLCDVIVGLKLEDTPLGVAARLLMTQEGGYAEEDTPIVLAAMKGLTQAMASDTGKAPAIPIRGPRRRHR